MSGRPCDARARTCSYAAGGVSLEFYWNVVWEVPARIRSACKACSHIAAPV